LEPVELRMQEIVIQEELFVLLPSRMIWWPRKETLLMADAHFGKAAVFREAGIPVPGGTTAEMLRVLSHAVLQFRARRILCLGDLVHAKTYHGNGYRELLSQWREQHAATAFSLVMGNHDRGQGSFFESLGIQQLGEPYREDRFEFAHYPLPSNQPASEYFHFAGHLHPGIRTRLERGVQMKFPCFYLTPTQCILPSFGFFTGMKVLEPQREDRVYAVVDDAVIPLR